jgi:hypothetical protein
MSVKDELIKEIELRLGGGMVDVELDSARYLKSTTQISSTRQQSSYRKVPKIKH